MIKKAFMLSLKPDSLAEYTEHHDNVWQELVDEIEKSGIAQITLFEADPVIFLYSEIKDEEAWDRLWSTGIYDKWAKLMQPLMDFNEDGTVATTDLNEIWNVETSVK